MVNFKITKKINHTINIFSLLILIMVMTNKPLNSQSNSLPLIEDFVPQWAKEVIWYQIFPERFNNGDTKNDPTIDRL